MTAQSRQTLEIVDECRFAAEWRSAPGVIAVNTAPLSRARNRSMVPSDKRTSSAPFPNRR